MEHHNALTAFAKRRLPRIVDEVFSSCSGPDMIRRFDRVELDLGAIPGDEFPDGIEERLRKKLKAFLDDHPVLNEPVSSTGFSRQFSPGLAEEDAILYFLENGVLPWNVSLPNAKDMAAFLEKRLEAGAGPFINRLRAVRNMEIVAKRMSRQFPESAIEKILEAADPGTGRSTREVIRRLGGFYAAETGGTFSGKTVKDAGSGSDTFQEIKAQVWEHTLLNTLKGPGITAKPMKLELPQQASPEVRQELSRILGHLPGSNAITLAGTILHYPNTGVAHPFFWAQKIQTVLRKSGRKTGRVIDLELPWIWGEVIFRCFNTLAENIPFKIETPLSTGQVPAFVPQESTGCRREPHQAITNRLPDDSPGKHTAGDQGLSPAGEFTGEEVVNEASEPDKGGRAEAGNITLRKGVPKDGAEPGMTDQPMENFAGQSHGDSRDGNVDSGFLEKSVRSPRVQKDKIPERPDLFQSGADNSSFWAERIQAAFRKFERTIEDVADQDFFRILGEVILLCFDALANDIQVKLETVLKTFPVPVSAQQENAGKKREPHQAITNRLSDDSPGKHTAGDQGLSPAGEFPGKEVVNEAAEPDNGDRDEAGNITLRTGVPKDGVDTGRTDLSMENLAGPSHGDSRDRILDPGLFEKAILSPGFQKDEATERQDLRQPGGGRQDCWAGKIQAALRKSGSKAGRVADSDFTMILGAVILGCFDVLADDIQVKLETALKTSPVLVSALQENAGREGEQDQAIWNRPLNKCPGKHTGEYQSFLPANGKPVMKSSGIEVMNEAAESNIGDRAKAGKSILKNEIDRDKTDPGMTGQSRDDIAGPCHGDSLDGNVDSCLLDKSVPGSGFQKDDVPERQVLFQSSVVSHLFWGEKVQGALRKIRRETGRMADSDLPRILGEIIQGCFDALAEDIQGKLETALKISPVSVSTRQENTGKEREPDKAIREHPWDKCPGKHTAEDQDFLPANGKPVMKFSGTEVMNEAAESDIVVRAKAGKVTLKNEIAKDNTDPGMTGQSREDIVWSCRGDSLEGNVDSCLLDKSVPGPGFQREDVLERQVLFQSSAVSHDFWAEKIQGTLRKIRREAGRVADSDLPRILGEIIQGCFDALANDIQGKLETALKISPVSVSTRQENTGKEREPDKAIRDRPLDKCPGKHTAEDQDFLPANGKPVMKSSETEVVNEVAESDIGVRAKAENITLRAEEISNKIYLQWIQSLLDCLGAIADVDAPSMPACLTEAVLPVIKDMIFQAAVSTTKPEVFLAELSAMVVGQVTGDKESSKKACRMSVKALTDKFLYGVDSLEANAHGDNRPDEQMSVCSPSFAGKALDAQRLGILWQIILSETWVRILTPGLSPDFFGSVCISDEKDFYLSVMDSVLSLAAEKRELFSILVLFRLAERMKLPITPFPDHSGPEEQSGVANHPGVAESISKAPATAGNSGSPLRKTLIPRMANRLIPGLGREDRLGAVDTPPGIGTGFEKRGELFENPAVQKNIKSTGCFVTDNSSKFKAENKFGHRHTCSIPRNKFISPMQKLAFCNSFSTLNLEEVWDLIQAILPWHVWETDLETVRENFKSGACVQPRKSLDDKLDDGWDQLADKLSLILKIGPDPKDFLLRVLTGLVSGDPHQGYDPGDKSNSSVPGLRKSGQPRSGKHLEQVGGFRPTWRPARYQRVTAAGTHPAAAFREWGRGSEPVFVENAGMVLSGPYLSMLFTKLDLIDKREFKSRYAAEKAVHVLEYMVTGEQSAPEYRLVLNKLLCGMEPDRAIHQLCLLEKSETDLIRELLLSMIAHWKALGKTSVEGFRQSFLIREGRLEVTENAWTLVVAPKPFDMLLDRIPWTFSPIRLPWMDRVLHVRWR